MKVFRSKLAAGFTLVEIMIVVLIIGILLAIAIPNFVSARESARAKACVGNLKQIDSASQQYAMDQKLNSTASLSSTTWQGQLSPSYIRAFPSCPESGTYAPGATLAVSPTCSLSIGTPSTTDYQGPSSTGAPAAGRYYHGL